MLEHLCINLTAKLAWLKTPLFTEVLILYWNVLPKHHQAYGAGIQNVSDVHDWMLQPNVVKSLYSCYSNIKTFSYQPLHT